LSRLLGLAADGSRLEGGRHNRQPTPGQVACQAARGVAVWRVRRGPGEAIPAGAGLGVKQLANVVLGAAGGVFGFGFE